MDFNPNYYSILPANVRYSKDLSDFEKILYSEITALSNKLGYCYASNSYFGKLYNKALETISRAINKIAKLGFIRVEIDKKNGNQRKIYITPIDKNVNTPIDKNVNTPIDKNVKYNNTRYNNTRYNTSYYKKKIKPVPDWYKDYTKELSKVEVKKLDIENKEDLIEKVKEMLV